MEGLTFTSHILRFVSSRRILHTRVKKGLSFSILKVFSYFRQGINERKYLIKQNLIISINQKALSGILSFSLQEPEPLPTSL